MTRVVREENASGLVRVSAEGLLGTHVLPAALGAIREAHPRMRFECIAPGFRSNPLRRDVDLTLSWARSSQESVVCTRVGSLRHGLYASKGWLERREDAVSTEAVARSGSLPATDAELGLAGLGSADVHGGCDPPPLSAEDGNVLLGAVRQSLGAGFLPEMVGDAEHRLRRVLPDTVFDRDVWLAVHPDLRAAPEIRVTIEAVRRELRRHRR